MISTLLIKIAEFLIGISVFLGCGIMLLKAASPKDPSSTIANLQHWAIGIIITSLVLLIVAAILHFLPSDTEN